MLYVYVKATSLRILVASRAGTEFRPRKFTFGTLQRALDYRL